MKWKLSLGCLAISSAIVSSNAFAGFYVGTEAGLKSIYSSTSTNFIVNTSGIPGLGNVLHNITLTDHSDRGYGGGDGVVYLGYERDFQHHLYGAIEGMAEFNSITANEHSSISFPIIYSGIPITAQELSIKNSFGLSIVPGVYFTDDLRWFVKAGVVYGRIHSKVTTPITVANETDNEWGGQYGTGFDYTLTKHWSLRSEMLYTSYGTFKHKNTQNLVIPSDSLIVIPITTSQSNGLHAMAFNIGVTYHFI